jgi:CBS domain-containing protein
MKVADIMTENPACCIPQTALPDVARLLCEHDCGAIPVVDSLREFRPVGIVTDRDIACRGFAHGHDPRSRTAEDCMSHPCVTVTPELSVEDCRLILQRYRIRRAPVIDRDGRCVGIVAQADIALNAAEADVARFLREISEPVGEPAGRR